MSVKEAAEVGAMEDDWTVRTLTGTSRDVRLSDAHVAAAAVVLRERFLVGLSDRMAESWFRIRNTFTWGGGKGARECSENAIFRNDVDRLSIVKELEARRVNGGGDDAASAGANDGFIDDDLDYHVDPTPEDLRALLSVNRYDMKLYEEALKIFDEQADLFYDPGDDWYWGDDKGETDQAMPPEEEWNRKKGEDQRVAEGVTAGEGASWVWRVLARFAGARERMGLQQKPSADASQGYGRQ